MKYPKKRKAMLLRQKSFAKVICKHIKCQKKFKPKALRQHYCSVRCRNRQALVVRPKKTLEDKLSWNHKMSVEEYEKLHKKGCALCGEPFNEKIRALIACIDHDHTCHRVGTSCKKCRRGLIHSKCNLILGHAKDNSELLRKAADYLEAYEKVQV
jgi:hypothetical protein